MRTSLVCLLAVCLAASAAAPKRKKPAPERPPVVSAASARWLKSMSVREKAAQLLMVRFYGDSPNTRSKSYREFVELVRDVRIGGLIVLNRVRMGTVEKAEPYQMAAFLNRMQKLAKVPLIVGGDFERGASMRMNSTTPFPHLMAYGAANDLEATRALGRATAREARAMGVHWVFAPDADVNNNPDNPVINVRAFGGNPQVVAAHVTAFIEGARQEKKNPVLLTVKHFPGHGDTVTDSHMGLAVVEASRERMEEVELVPFRAAIAAGVDSVMTAHLRVAAYEEEEIPGTVSKKILTGLLREQLGFKGIIVTDAMDMQGLSKQFPPGEAAVRAIEAGADLLCVPPNPREAVRAIAAAVESGRLSRKRLDASVLRILEAKVRVGLPKHKLVDLEALSDQLDSAEDEDSASDVARKALTLIKNDGAVLPFRSPGAACYFVLGAGRFSTQGRDLVEAIRARATAAKTFLLEPRLGAAEIEELVRAAALCDGVAVAAYVTASAYRGNVALAGNYPALMDKLIEGGAPLALVALGSPYLARTYPRASACLATFSTARPAELAAVEALFGEIRVDGKLPVTIPGVAEYGFGLTMERRK